MRTLIAATVAAVLLAGAARADEPTKYYLAEDGRVIAKKVADLETEVAALKKELAARKACTCSGECCGAKPTAAPTPAGLPNPASEPELWSLDGYPMRRMADGRRWERVPGAAQRPDKVFTGYAPPTFAAPTYSLPSGHVLPAGGSGCPGGACPTPRR